MGRPKHWEKGTADLDTPQGCKNSPSLFGEALAADLAAFPRETLNCTLLQYLDDLLLASRPQGDCWRHQRPVGSTLHHRAQGVMEKGSDRSSSTWGLSSQKGIRHSDMRGSKPSVQYLGRTPRKKSCCIWILGFSEIAKPLFKATAGSGKGPQ